MQKSSTGWIYRGIKMFYNIQKGSIKQDESETGYISFGKGKKILVIIPGVSLRNATDSAMALAYMYRLFSKDYKVYVFDRKKVLKNGYTIEEMAADITYAMKELKIKNADIFGVSQGGIIAQYLAINNPEMVHKLVLGVTASKTNKVIKEVIGSWLKMALDNNYGLLAEDMMLKMYSASYVKRYKWLFPLLKKIAKPKDTRRFTIILKACLSFNTYDRLDKIKCPVLVLGGSKDKVVTGEASIETAEKLNCHIYMYKDLGHAAYEEAKDFNSRIYKFLNKN